MSFRLGGRVDGGPTEHRVCQGAVIDRGLRAPKRMLAALAPTVGLDSRDGSTRRVEHRGVIRTAHSSLPGGCGLPCGRWTSYRLLIFRFERTQRARDSTLSPSASLPEADRSDEAHSRSAARALWRSDMRVKGLTALHGAVIAVLACVGLATVVVVPALASKRTPAPARYVSRSE